MALLHKPTGSMPCSRAPTSQKSLADAVEQLDAWHGDGDRFVTVLDEDNPARLRDIREPPLLTSSSLEGKTSGACA